MSGKSGKSDGKCNRALLNDPRGVAVDRNGTLFLADTYNHRICIVKNGLLWFCLIIDKCCDYIGWW